MARNYTDWLQAYVDYASYSEAPRRMHFWTGVSTIAGVLRRRVWLDMAYFQWTPCFYIVLVAPPGIVSKSTTASIGMDLLRQVPGVNFGPDVVTWPALVTAFAEVNECFELNGEWYTQSALTLESSEFGNLVNPQDRDMIDLLVNLWDSKRGAFKKRTKGSGSDVVENPWINLIACTTPAWIAGNFPEYVIGGGFTSRCVFVYADVKDKYVAYPALHVPLDKSATEAKLVQDLEQMAINLCGPFELLPDAIDFGEAWYTAHFENIPEALADDRFGGYIARKQTHLHKLALVISASQRDDQTINAHDLATANTMITDLEADMPKVFAKIGRSQESVQAERLAQYVVRQGTVTYDQAYRYSHSAFPRANDFEQALLGLVRSGQLRMGPGAGGIVITGVDHVSYPEVTHVNNTSLERGNMAPLEKAEHPQEENYSYDNVNHSLDDRRDARDLVDPPQDQSDDAQDDEQGKQRHDETHSDPS